MSWLLTLPLLIPLLTTIFVLFARVSPKLQRIFAFCGQVFYLFIAIKLFIYVCHHGYLTTQVGSWPAPFGITLIADMLSAMMVLLTAIVSFCVTIYSYAEIDDSYCHSGFYPAYFVLLMGLNGAFLTGDIFNLYVWVEVILISSFLLLAIGGRKEQLVGAVKYAVLSLIATLILLTAIAFLYGVTGTLNMADLALLVLHSKYVGLITTISILFIIAFGMKAALFPMFFWLPAAYPNTTYTTSSIFAALLTKVGVYTLIRMFTLIFLLSQSYTHAVLLIIACATLLVGILCAVAQRELRRLFSYNLISHIGYMIIGLAIFSPLALMGSLFYLLQHILVKCNLFLCAGFIGRVNGSTEYTHRAGLYKKFPFFALLFFIAAFSLAGVPPLSGFWPKFMLVKASLQSHNYTAAIIILVVSFMTLFVMARAWQVMFLSAKTDKRTLPKMTRRHRVIMLVPICLLSLLILFVGIIPMPAVMLVKMISQQLLHPMQYVHAVLRR